jgi:hypothetical protein
MEFDERFKELKARVMKKIAEAAIEHDTGKVTHLSRLAGLLEEDQQVLVGLKERIEGYQEEINGGARVAVTADLKLALPSGSHSQRVPTQRSREEDGHSARAQGFETRQRYVAHLVGRGIQLSPVKGKPGGKVYRTNSGSVVGLTFANELDAKPERWWLGIKDGKYDVVVLLCNRSREAPLDFVLPSELLRRIWSSLSRNGHQVEFNVRKDGQSYYLLVPYQRQESITSFLGNLGPLGLQRRS